ncbi:hypothetical protein FPZ43_12995 [Mucilaginibacter pallidiroseus]|uniref:Uncharacterized protein n=1 Tax=Mucilaginibacter pallidiroseus TaxID=2599295 RepID=A0A563U7V2_9SPHI|nr:hypothetical protein [Mucilaginibacter pallidiroseus]TWR27394.1 hypothetical protein FPZ43_12995 [Mucilaginibacter pallidiroseus]
MLTHDFERLLIIFFLIIFFALVGYGAYCKRKSNSYIGTGRVADIELWELKAIATWVVTFCIIVALLIEFF